MKRLIVIFLSALLCVCSYAGKKKKMFVEYSKTFSGVRYTPVWEGDSAILLVSITNINKSDFITTPILMLRTEKDEVLKIEGQALEGKTHRTRSSSSSFVGVGVPGTGLYTGVNIGSDIDYYVASAKFYLTKEQMMKLKDGIVKVRINTVPYAHEREFKKDKIGRELYRIFREAKWDQEDF